MTDVRSERLRKHGNRSTDPRDRSDGCPSKPSERNEPAQETASDNGCENPGSDGENGERNECVSPFVVQCGAENPDGSNSSKRRTRTKETP